MKIQVALSRIGPWPMASGGDVALAELLSLVEAANIRQTVRSSRSVQLKQTCARLTPALDISALDISNSAMIC